MARDGPVPVVPGGARRGGFSGSAALALDPLLVLSQPTRCKTFALWRGVLPPPFEPPGNPPLRQRSRLGESARLPPGRPSTRPVAGCSPADPRSSPVEAVDFAGESAS